MDTKLAINVLENTFKKKFDIGNFEYFLTELFNDVEINTIEEKQYVKQNLKNTSLFPIYSPQCCQSNLLKMQI